MRRTLTRNLLPAVLIITLLAPGALLAQEVIVKNDSVVDFGTAVIVGDFVASDVCSVVGIAP